MMDEQMNNLIEVFRSKMLEKYNVDGQIRIPEGRVISELYKEFGDYRLCMSNHDTTFDHLTIDSDLKFTEYDISCADVFYIEEVIPDSY